MNVSKTLTSLYLENNSKVCNQEQAQNAQIIQTNWLIKLRFYVLLNTK